MHWQNYFSDAVTVDDNRKYTGKNFVLSAKSIFAHRDLRARQAFTKKEFIAGSCEINLPETNQPTENDDSQLIGPILGILLCSSVAVRDQLWEKVNGYFWTY
jgi:hypothetical protein